MQQKLTIERILQNEGDKHLPLLNHILQRANLQLACSLSDDSQNIKNLRIACLARNAILFNELEKVLQDLNMNGVEAILLKGAMMEGIYPAGVRRFADIDLLIRRQDMSVASQTMLHSGYKICPLLSKIEYFTDKLNYVKKAEIPIIIELHASFGLLYPYSGRLQIKDFWARAEHTHIQGIDAQTLCPEDSLLHFCLHLIHHLHSGWIVTACDIAELTHHYRDKFDWEHFLNEAFRSQTALPVSYSLKRTVDLFDPPIPVAVIDKLSRYKPAIMERWLFNWLTRPGDKYPTGSRLLADLYYMPGVTLKVRRILAELFLK